MGIPKKHKPLADKQKIRKAIEIADGNTHDKDKTAVIEKKEATPAKKSSKRLGRPPIAADRDRSAKITFYASVETQTRFNLAFLQEQYKMAKEGKKIDKSLVLERAVEEWLASRGY